MRKIFARAAANLFFLIDFPEIFFLFLFSFAFFYPCFLFVACFLKLKIYILIHIDYASGSVIKNFSPSRFPDTRLLFLAIVR